MLKKQTNSDAMRSSPRKNQSANSHDDHSFQPKRNSTLSLFFLLFEVMFLSWQRLLNYGNPRLLCARLFVFLCKW